MNHSAPRDSAVKPALMDTLEPRQLFAYDLAATAISSASTVAVGETLGGSVTIMNKGNTPSPGGTVYYALTRVSVNGDNDGPQVVGRIGQAVLSPLSPGQTVVLPLSLAVSSAMAKGSYFLSAVASERTGPIDDPNADVDFELNDIDGENNDISTDQKVTVVGAAAAVGKVDNAFGTGGASSTTIPQKLAVAQTVFVTESGRQFSAVTGRNSRGPAFGLLRFNADGAVDLGYGSGPGGVLGLGDIPPAEAKSISRLDDDSLLATGKTDQGDVVLARLNLQGELVNQFGNGGVLVVGRQSVPGLVQFDVRQVLTGANHSAMLIGTSGAQNQRRVTVLKITGSGARDMTFGNAGVVYLNAPEQENTQAATTLADGRLLIAGSRRSEVNGETSQVSAVAIMLTAQGVLDSTFGVGGRVLLAGRTSAFESYTAVAEADDGTIYLAGLSRTGSDTGSTALVVRLKRDGKVETKFNKTGVLTVSTGTTFESAASVIPTGDGGALVSIRTATSLAAVSAGKTGASVARVLPTGTLLSSYGSGGILTVTAAPITTAEAVSTAFDTYAESSDAEAQDVGGGKVRLLATTTTDTTTTLTATQLVADGVDVQVTTTASVSGAALIGKASTMKVTLSNIGTLSLSGKTTVTVTLLTDPDDTTGTTASTTVSSLKLAAGASKAVTLKFKFPTVGVKRAYYLAADVALPSGTSDIDTTNNRASATGLVTVWTAYSSVSFNLDNPPTPVSTGKTVTLKVTGRNFGNTAASGGGTARLLLTQDPKSTTDALLFGTVTFGGSLKANASGTLSIKIKVPTDFVLESGRYLVAEFSGKIVVLDDNLTDNSATTSSPLS